MQIPSFPELGREAFLAAERAAREARRAEARDARRALDRAVVAAEAQYRAARAPACPADYDEVTAAFEAVCELAELTDAFAVNAETTLARLARADPGLVAADPRFVHGLADVVGERLADRDLGALLHARVRRLEVDR